LVLGIGGAIVGLMMAVIKIALLVIIPVAIMMWLFRMFFGRSTN
jgi:hypothetical protein